MREGSAIRPFLGRLYRRCAAPFGLRTLNDMLANGLPAPLGPPLRFLFTQELPDEAIGIAAHIGDIRAEISRRPDSYRYGYAAAVDVGRFGLLVWSGGDTAGARYDLSRFTGWWQVGSEHRPAG
jgi:hypothetical protein